MSGIDPSNADAPTADLLTTWMTQARRLVEEALEQHLPEPCISSQLHEAMRYAVLGGGKRIRPLLCLAAGELNNAPQNALYVAAVAVELIHAYSLIHDDLPSMDDDQLRRGRPTCHARYGEATALLAGDALQSLAFETLASQALNTPERQLKMLKLLAHAAGSSGMAGGQAIDLHNVGKTLDTPMLELMHSKKTGALIRAAILLGVECGAPLKESEKTDLAHFAGQVGLLFQIVDDILDCTSSSDALGKTAGKDQASNKPTFVSALGLPAARQYAADLHRDARQALASFGRKAERLRALTDYVCDRQF